MPTNQLPGYIQVPHQPLGSTTAALKRFLREGAFGASLLVGGVRLLGEDLLTWDPETVLLEMRDALGDPLPRADANKLMAAISVATSNEFYKSLPHFITICNALYSGRMDPRVFDPAEAIEIAWGMAEAYVIWPPDDHANALAPEIVAYIELTLQHEGVARPPDVLRVGPLADIEWETVTANFSDDPGMFAAIVQMQTERAQDIDTEIAMRLKLLIAQLRAFGAGAPAKDLASELLQTHRQAT